MIETREQLIQDVRILALASGCVDYEDGQILDGQLERMPVDTHGRGVPGLHWWADYYRRQPKSFKRQKAIR